MRHRTSTAHCAILALVLVPLPGAAATAAPGAGFEAATPPGTAASAGAAATGKGRPRAEAQIRELEGSGVNGQLEFRHAGAFVWIEGEVGGLSPGKHGIHVHEGKSCEQRGGHFNPTSTRHGSPDQPYDMRHVGDLGNLVVLEGGTARYSRIDTLARLAGPHSIVGRVVVVHQGEDDYISQPSGNSGKEIACGVIRAIRK